MAFFVYTSKYPYCKISGCKEKSISKGYCKKHHNRKLTNVPIISLSKRDKNIVKIFGNYAKIYIHNDDGKTINYSIIDSLFVTEIKKHKWNIDRCGYVRNCKIGFLHKLILRLNGTYDVTKIVDHKNRNKLDNTLNNLRMVNPTINARNRELHKTNKSGARGVYFSTTENCWIAEIQFSKNSHQKHIAKYFHNFDDAVKYRQFLENKYWGNDR